MVDNPLDIEKNQISQPAPTPPPAPTQEELEARRQEQEAKKNEALAKARQSAIDVQARIDTRRQEQIYSGQQNTERFLQESARNSEIMQSMNTRATNPNQGSKAPKTFDIARRTFIDAPVRDRSQETADKITQVKQFAGITALGATAPKTNISTSVKLDAETLMTQNVSELSAQDRQAITNSSGGEIALAEYDTKKNAVISEIENSITSIRDKYGIVDTDKLAEVAVNSKDFDPVMAGDVKRAIMVIDSEYNKNLLQVESFKESAKELQWVRDHKTLANKESAKESQRVRDDKTLANSGIAKAMDSILPKNLKESTLPSNASRLIQGGMTPSEVILKSVITEFAQPIEDEKYTKAVVRKVARFVLGDDVNLDGIATQTETVTNASDIEGAIEDNLAEQYRDAIQGGGDIRESMTAKIAQEVLSDDMSEQEKLYYINQVWIKVDEFAKNEVVTKSGNIRQAQTNRVRLDAAEFANTVALHPDYEAVFQSKAWAAAKDSPEGQTKVLEDGFRGEFDRKMQTMFDQADPNDIVDLQETYSMYLSVLGTDNETALAKADPNFADILASRDAFVAEGEAISGNRKFLEKEAREDAGRRGKLVAFDSKGNPTEFNRDTVGVTAFASYKLADDDGKKKIDAAYSKQRDVQATLKARGDAELTALALGTVRVEKWGIEAGRGGGVKDYGEEYIVPDTEGHWDAYMGYIRTDFNGYPEVQQKLMQAAIAQKEVWKEEMIETMQLSSGQSREDIKKQLDSIGEADPDTKLSFRGTGETKTTLRKIAKSELKVGSEKQPRIPDAQFIKVANGVAVEKLGMFENKEGHTLMFGMGKDGNVKVVPVPDDQVEAKKKIGLYTFE